MLFANFASNTGLFSSVTVGEISHKYDTLFAPAGYAFTIWGIIFLACIAFVIYQWRLLKLNDPRQIIYRTGGWFILSNIANGAWLFCWTNEMLGMSVLLIILLLSCLCMLTYRLRLEIDDEPLLTIFFIWWPIAIYLGWVIVATVACIAAWLVYVKWNAFGINPEIWTVFMIAIATILYLILIKRRNLREAALVGVWAFLAIAVRQRYDHSIIFITALVAAFILILSASVQAYQNRNYNVLVKIKKGAWE